MKRKFSDRNRLPSDTFDKEILKQRLFRKRIIKEGHWLYPGPRIYYGHINVCGRNYQIHRISAYVFLGLDLNNKNHFACHKKECPYKSCFNPDHLYIGNNYTNQIDSVEVGTSYNARKTHCPHGHEYSKSNTYWRSNGRRICKTCYTGENRRIRENEASRLRANRRNDVII